METDQPPKENQDEPTVVFKKPILIGRIGRLPKKITQKKDYAPKVDENVKTTNVVDSTNSTSSPAQQLTENNVAIPYKEPSWSGLPENPVKYGFDVLKSGSIIQTVNLMNKPYYVFGRLPACDIIMEHPTISRYHAVIQYRSTPSDKQEAGFYIYDLGSTHGTFLNKNKLKTRVYVRIQVGHMLKLGCSTRTYILTGPETDEEEESELSVTELKQKRIEDLRKRAEAEKEAALKAEKEEELRKKREEERGVDWGMGEDADEETDLSENPYAQTNNEDLYLDDPKKALRGFFEREGLDLEYDCSEQGMGQFLCKVELPVDDELGMPIVAEVIHKGKKKEAVVQCALEACRILDRHGVLRQATHESRKRKAKNWEENDYYDSDEDTFFDRTGSIEKKREMRMSSKTQPKVETYESLLLKEKEMSKSISELEAKLAKAQAALNEDSKTAGEEDSLDSFMKELKESKPDKHSVSKLKTELTKMKTEHANVIRLANIAKPASLPPLVPQYSSAAGTSKASTSKMLPMFGKRRKIKVQLPAKPAVEENKMDADDEDEEEEEEEEQVEKNNLPSVTSGNEETINEESNSDSNDSDVSRNSQQNSDDDNKTENTAMNNTYMTFRKFEMLLKKGLPPFADKHTEKFKKILNKLKKLATDEDRMHVDWKTLKAKKRKVMKLIADLPNCEPNEKLEHQISSELNRILAELNAMAEQKYKVIGQVKQVGNDIKDISEAINKDYHKYKLDLCKMSEPSSSSENPKIEIQDETNEPSTSNDTESSSEASVETEEKKKKKNQRRIQHRQERAEIERQRGYEEDANRDDYSMWMPPQNQTGDGRTSLNDKLGY